MDCVIFDIDGTLADVRHRRGHVSGGKRDWEAFFAAMALDPLIEPVARLITPLNDAGLWIVLCSGRPEKYRSETEKWLLRNNVYHDRLYMRPDDDTRQDYIVKRQMLDGIRADGFEPVLVIDDRQSVVDMWRESDLVCLQAAPGDFDQPSQAGMLTLMVGPSGAGKTTWLKSPAAELLGISASQILNSDEIRGDLCGDFRDQSKNDEVFSALHSVAKARLRNGLPTVVDATNLRRKDRMAVAETAPAGARIRYIVIDRPMEEKRRDAGWRAEVPGDLLARHDQTFRSQLKDILSGDHLPNVEVIDLRKAL